ncbi:E3 ubiquitin-protein ligase SH3RF3 [Drosophila tropicalis]|uniref:E3 ubiquitin-protein ligase SH3RF3 n=1 Tax=Drosophila tropicalis TaxID=46794 RepID=UPI0035AB713A
MDEHTLNDLLECSVCFERLDCTSRVLPCQHTFCRKCLLDIVASQNKLRCPECRILVSVRIDELPPNVLLMRILEGMKQNAAGGKIDHRSEDTNKTPLEKLQPAETTPAKSIAPSTAAPSLPFSNVSHPQSGATSTASSQHSQPSRHKPRRFLLPHAYALFDYISNETNDLKFRKGDLILLKQRIDNNWFVGQANGQEGTFPINYVKVAVPLAMPQCIAMYDFKMGPNDEEGCLEFKKSTVIHVLRRVDHNWAEGRIGQTIGIFPIAFVELNAAAKKLLESLTMPTSCHQQQPQRALPPVPLIDPTVVSSNTESSSGSSNGTPISSTSSSTASSKNCSPNHQPTLPNTPQHVMASGSGSVRFRDKGAKEKRHSLNALLGNGAPLSLLQSNRHSAEILSLPNELSRLEVATATVTSPPTRVLKTHVQQQVVPPSLPWGYLALFPYKPRQNDELELKKGCVYIVTERCVDGWFKGKNWLDISGVFPGNYLTPLRTRDQQQLMHQWKFVPQITDAKQNPPPTVAQDVRLNNILPIHPPDLPPRQQQPSTSSTSCSVWTKPVEALFSRKSDSKQDSSSSSGAVGLMRRLTHMKTRSKSPGAPLHQAAKEDTNSKTSQSTNLATSLHPVHVRSGSCPSQLQLNETSAAPTPAPNAAPPSKQMPISYGSQRIKSNKERPQLLCARQSLDANTFRSMYDNGSTALAPPATSSTSGSSPIVYVQAQSQTQTTQLHANMILAPTHRKSQSLDAGHVLCGTNNVITEAAIKASATTKSAYGTRESRFRCIVPYPPNNSDIELELHVGDIIYVQRKQKNGWYKGTHARTHKTGLFPASFVEPDI